MPPSFTAQYLTVRFCAQKLAEQPDLATAEDIETCNQILSDTTHRKQTCAHFLYQEAAMALSRFIRHTRPSKLRTRAWHILDTFTSRAVGSTGLATAQALGSLPLSIDPPAGPSFCHEPVQSLNVSALVRKAGFRSPRCTRAGRNLLLTDQAVADRVLVLKLAQSHDQAAGLAHEAWWMEYLAHHPDLLPGQHIPSPLDRPCRVLFDLDCIPDITPLSLASKTPMCLPYIAHAEYFSYALSPDPGCNLSGMQFQRVLAQAALGLGRLSRHGLIHKAPIPLFHNRVQSGRRDDQGLYIWTRGGRLDRWFDSCLYPNFGLSGLRDFEHLEPWSKYPRHLFRDLGAQIMSLILAAGCWFRLQDPQLMGLTAHGDPVDARHLFDRYTFIRHVQIVVTEFSTGFLGAALDVDKLGCEKVVEPLIEALGVDRHMTEVFRMQDQLGYDFSSFQALVQRKALNAAHAQHCRPGENDITLVTGPHLGEFNSRISVPELITFTASVAGLCIARAYLDALPAQ